MASDSPEDASTALFLGVDVGSWTARAVVVDSQGRRQSAPCSSPIQTFRAGLPDRHVEQSSEDIWQAVCKAVRAALSAPGLDPKRVLGIGFCATCSLVALDEALQPTTISTTGLADHNIIMWQDGRATLEAEEINLTGSRVLDYVGGQIIPEMDVPRILWMQRHLKQAPAHLVELPDYLTLRATGSTARSVSSLVCKFNYINADDSERGIVAGWNTSYMKACGLENFDLQRLGGSNILQPGSPVGEGLCQAAADDLGLHVGTPVAASLIDAYCGALGVLGCNQDVSAGPPSWSERMAVIAGTSNCFIALTDTARFVPGVWGPHASAVVPGLFCNESGQNAGGLFLQHILDMHPATASVQKRWSNHSGGGVDHSQSSMSVHQALDLAIEEHCKKLGVPWGLLTSKVHLTPDICGNRSPWSSPDMSGVLSGSTLEDTSETGLIVRYIAALQALAYGTRVLIERLNDHGYNISMLPVCGGLASNNRFLQALADACQVDVIAPSETEGGLLGAALSGASAAGHAPDLVAAMCQLTSVERTLRPDKRMKAYHDAKYRIFLELCERNKAHAESMKRTLDAMKASGEAIEQKNCK